MSTAEQGGAAAAPEDDVQRLEHYRREYPTIAAMFMELGSADNLLGFMDDLDDADRSTFEVLASEYLAVCDNGDNTFFVNEFVEAWHAMDPAWTTPQRAQLMKRLFTVCGSSIADLLEDGDLKTLWHALEGKSFDDVLARFQEMQNEDHFNDFYEEVCEIDTSSGDGETQF
jgi:hypothetical protein